MRRAWGNPHLAAAAPLIEKVLGGPWEPLAGLHFAILAGPSLLCLLFSSSQPRTLLGPFQLCSTLLPKAPV